MTKSWFSVSTHGRVSLFLAQFLAVSAALVVSLGLHAFAQAAPTDAGAQPFFYPAPPEGFDPISASDSDLAKYGFPSRPPLATSDYNRWASVMVNAKHRVANPTAQNTGIVHGPRRQGFHPPTGDTANTKNTTNWSGVDEVYSYPFFAASNNGYGSIVVGGWDQPSIGYENCTYGPYKAWTWIGMDGSGDAIAGNSDVLQAGFAAEACPRTTMHGTNGTLMDAGSIHRLSLAPPIP